MLDISFNGSQDIVQLLVDVDKRSQAQVMIVEICEDLAQTIKRNELILTEVDCKGFQT